MDKNEILANFTQELRRGSLILCVLANLKEATYGYSLIEELSKTGIAIEANTLYPLLRRLETQKLLASTWNTDGAKPRKYYELTVYGKEVLQDLKEQWYNTAHSMDAMLQERKE